MRSTTARRSAINTCMNIPGLDQRATFTEMKAGTAAEWQIVLAHGLDYSARLAERILDYLGQLAGHHGGYAVDRLEHSLQTATRALRDGRDEEYVVCALVHDIGDMLCTFNHSDLAAAVVRPFVSEKNHFMVQNHGIFQGYYFFEHFGLDPNARERFRGHAWFDYTAEFCELYDQAAFDPSYRSMSLEDFAPMVRRLFSYPRSSLYTDSSRSAA